MNDNYLKHYGVLGMKWGIRRSRKFAEKAKRTRNSAKAKEYKAKSRKIENYHKKMAGASTYNWVKNTSTGKALVQSYVFGTYGALKYNEARSKHASRGKAAVNALVYGTGNNLTGGILSVVEPRLNKNKKKK